MQKREIPVKRWMIWNGSTETKYNACLLRLKKNKKRELFKKGEGVEKRKTLLSAFK